MIKSSELREGVWIKSIHTGPVKVSLFMMGEIADDETYLDHLMPIPLTPELLQKAGLHKHNNAWVTGDYDEKNYMKDYFTIWNVHDGEYKLNTTQFAIEVTSLHQLQNLYYALTSTELNIQL